MSRTIGIVVGGLLWVGTLGAEAPPVESELERLVVEFLAGASRSDSVAHERFWDEELIYTSSSGKRFGKAEILRDLAASRDAPAAEPETNYTAEKMQIRPYGSTAVVAFELVGTTVEGAETKVERYLNTGTFVRRRDGWRAVAWQATRVPAAAPAAAAN